MLTAEQILSMPLTELQERVQLAERLALAARLTPESGHYAAAVPSVQPQAAAAAPAETASRGRGRPPKNTAATPTPTPSPTPTATSSDAPALASDDLSLDMDDGTGTQAAADGAELSLGDDDMDMLGLDTPASPTVDPDTMRKEIVRIATEIRDKQDKTRLTAVRGLMQKYGVNRVSEVSEQNLAAFYNEIKAV